MYIIIEHEITDPTSFGEAVTADIPAHLKLHQSLPNPEGTRAVCLWEAHTVDEVKQFVEPLVGHCSHNTYFAVASDKALGLPTPVETAETV